MKKSILPILLIAGLSASAQKLPEKVTIVLTDKQVLKLDSAIQIISGQLDSKQLTKFLQDAALPVFQQVRAQLVADKPKEQPVVTPPAKKP